MVLSADGESLYSGSRDGSIRKWSTFTGIILFTFTFTCDILKSIIASPSGQFLFASFEDNSMIKVYDLSTGLTVTKFHTNKDQSSSNVCVDSNFENIYVWADNHQVYK